MILVANILFGIIYFDNCKGHGISALLQYVYQNWYQCYNDCLKNFGSFHFLLWPRITGIALGEIN